jgi:glycosyltransferase involved in cell wall biosynthesis
MALTDAISLMQQRLASENPAILGKIYRWALGRMALDLERRALPKATKVQIVSESDRVYLCSEVRNAQVEYIGLAVSRETLALGSHKRAADRGLRLFFSSDLRIGHLRRGLLWFLAEVYPKVARVFPGIRLSIVGKDAETPEMKLAIASLPGVSVSSWVTDYDAELATADVVIVPDPCGGGAKNRVLRAMAMGRPVVGTPSAFEGIAFQDGVGGFCCHSADEFEKSLGSLLRDPELRAQVGDAGHRFAREYHSLDVIGPRWLDLYARAIATFSEPPTDAGRSRAA